MKAKRRMVGLCAAFLATVAVVGAGFSAWIFGSEHRDDVNLGVKIEYATQFGKFERTDTNEYNLILDQGDSALNKAVGISVDNNGPITYTWTIPTEVYNSMSADLVYGVNIYIKDATLGQYVEVTNLEAPNGDYAATAPTDEGAIDHTHEGYTGKQKILQGAGENLVSYYTVEYRDDNNTVVTLTFNFADVTFEYKQDKKPQTFDAYEKMVQTIKGDTEAVEENTVYKIAATDNALIVELFVIDIAPNA